MRTRFCRMRNPLSDIGADGFNVSLKVCISAVFKLVFYFQIVRKGGHSC